MRAKLIVEGKEFPIEIQDPELEKLLKPKKKTGYERIDSQCTYWAVMPDGDSYAQLETNSYWDDQMYKCANYYSDKTVAENNARADKLMRQLRRFAVECRTKDNPTEKYYIYYMKQVGLQVSRSTNKHIGPWFDTLHNAVKAIETFKDELNWYFTEYKDSL